MAFPNQNLIASLPYSCNIIICFRWHIFDCFFCIACLILFPPSISVLTLSSTIYSYWGAEGGLLFELLLFLALLSMQGLLRGWGLWLCPSSHTKQLITVCITVPFKVKTIVSSNRILSYIGVWSGIT